MGLNLHQTVVKFLRANPDQKKTAREIAEWIFKTYRDECRQKQKRSKARVVRDGDDAALIQQIVAEIPARFRQKPHPEIKTTEGRPRKFYFTQSTDQDEVDYAEHRTVSAPSSASSSASSEVDGPPAKEHDLYPMLSAFLWSEFAIYSKRIDEKRSRNSQGSGGNKWLYPDLVGMQNLSSDWNREIKDCVRQYADQKATLWSFEVKILINRSNLREAFFQAVSNSSWANFGYLVASDVRGKDTLKELNMLTSLHGIGFINLDTDTPSDSQVMIPARERSQIDWNIANRLTEENKDFLEYIELVRQFYQTDKIRRFDWDMKSGADTLFNDKDG